MPLNPSALPDFPWDSLDPYRERASSHPGGAVLLDVGAPVDSSPPVVREALCAASNSPGYPLTRGIPSFRAAAVEWLGRRGVRSLDPSVVLPTIGSKEFIGSLPAFLGLGSGDTVVRPSLAYPTYDVGATLVGSTILATDDVESWAGRSDVRLVWVNSPSNPTGRVLDRTALAAVVEAARAIGAIVVSDECYAEFPWEEPWVSDGVPSVLEDEICRGSHEGILAVYSLSKRSNMAGYRAGFVVGDPDVTSRLLETRRHLGLMVPTPVQAAAEAALGDDSHVEAQRGAYGRRRGILLPALEETGFRVDHSEAGLYLWATKGDPCWDTMAWFAQRGIVVAPGAFYGAEGNRHVRITLTASDAHIEEAANRLLGPR